MNFLLNISLLYVLNNPPSKSCTLLVTCVLPSTAPNRIKSAEMSVGNLVVFQYFV